MFKVGDIVVVKDDRFGLITYDRGRRYIIIEVVRNNYVKLADLLTLQPLQRLVAVNIGNLDSHRLEDSVFSMDHFMLDGMWRYD